MATNAVIFFNNSRVDELSEKEFEILEGTLDSALLLRSRMFFYNDQTSSAINHCYRVYGFISIMSSDDSIKECFESLCKHYKWCENRGYKSYECFIIPYTKSMETGYVRDFYSILKRVYEKNECPKYIKVAPPKNVFYGDADSIAGWCDCAKNINYYIRNGSGYFKNDSDFKNMRDRYEYDEYHSRFDDDDNTHNSYPNC